MTDRIDAMRRYAQNEPSSTLKPFTLTVNEARAVLGYIDDLQKRIRATVHADGAE